jgi:hypothetical protein
MKVELRSLTTIVTTIVLLPGDSIQNHERTCGDAVPTILVKISAGRGHWWRIGRRPPYAPDPP